jgi:hypothetical protein
MPRFFQKLSDYVLYLFGIAFLILFACYILKCIIQPCAPVITVLFVICGTVYAFNHWQTAVLSIAGIILYGCSWLTVSTWGVIPSELICVTGILAWFMAMFQSLPQSYRLPILIKSEIRK